MSYSICINICGKQLLIVTQIYQDCSIQYYPITQNQFWGFIPDVLKDRMSTFWAHKHTDSNEKKQADHLLSVQFYWFIARKQKPLHSTHNWPKTQRKRLLSVHSSSPCEYALLTVVIARIHWLIKYICLASNHCFSTCGIRQNITGLCAAVSFRRFVLWGKWREEMGSSEVWRSWVQLVSYLILQSE